MGEEERLSAVGDEQVSALVADTLSYLRQQVPRALAPLDSALEDALARAAVPTP